MSLKNNLHDLKEKYKGTKMAPAFNAIHTFLYLPNDTTHDGTHIKAADDLKRTMNIVIMALVPCLIFGMFNAGYQHHLALGTIESAQGFLGISFWTWDNLIIGMWKVLPLVVVSYGVGLAIEFLFAVIKGHEVEEGYLVTGMLVPLIVPIDLPLWMLAVAVAFGVVIGKEVFGGTGMNILNPALTIRAFLFFAYPTKMSGNKVWINTDITGGEALVDGYSGETFLAQSIESSSNYVNVAGQAYESTSEAFMNAFWGFVPGSIGETSAVAILIGAAILLISGIGSWRIMLSFFVGGYVMGLLFNAWGANEL